MPPRRHRLHLTGRKVGESKVLLPLPGLPYSAWSVPCASPHLILAENAQISNNRTSDKPH